MTKDKAPSAIKTWWVAVRPFAYTGSVLPVIFGSVLAWALGAPFLWGRFLIALFGIVCFHTSANLMNDVFDFRRGLDRVVNPVSGAIVRGWLSDRQVYVVSFLCLVVGVACGLVLVRLAGWPVLAIGVAGTVIVLGYTRSGFCLKYAGLGDLAIFLAFGLLPVVGAFWVQAERFSWVPVILSVPVVSHTVGILHSNNWRDIASDTELRCRTFAGLLGSRGSAFYYRLLVLGPFVYIAVCVMAAWMARVSMATPPPALLVLLASPLALKLAGTNWPEHPAEFAMLDARTAQLHLVFGVLLTLGFIVARLVAGAA